MHRSIYISVKELACIVDSRLDLNDSVRVKWQMFI